jgi:hypothetical protein
MMMSHDPFQTYQTLGVYSGGGTPYGLPYNAIQHLFNPIQHPFHLAALAGQQFQQPALGGYGNYPQTLQGAGQQSPWQQQFQPVNPLAVGLQNQLLHQQLAQLAQAQLAQAQLAQAQLAQGQLGQNPGLGANLQNPQLNPMLAYQGWPQQQTQFTYPLAPQSLIGAGIGQPFGQIGVGGIGQPFGQINPLQQLALRSAMGYGVSPLAGCF